MRAFVGQLDGVTWTILAIGLLAGVVWLVSLPVGLALSGLLAPIAAMLLVLRRRWLEIGLLLTGMGLVPLIAYRILGPPLVRETPRDGFMPIELLAPGAAYIFLVIGLGVTVVTGVFEARNGRRRELVEARHAKRKRQRLDREALG